MTEQKAPPQLRLRVFAGPNGSGKSTVIKMIRDTIVDDDRTKLDVGSYINADDIAKALTNNIFSFADYEISCGNDDVLKFAEASGLLFDNFSLEKLSSAFDINNNKLELLDKQSLDRVAQIIGIDDFVAGKADIKKATENFSKSDYHLVLNHCPQYSEQISLEVDEKIPVDLILSGHTHGGQINFFGFVPFLPQGSGRFVGGWYTVGKHNLYVSKGIGTSILPIRFGARAEIAIFNF